MNSQIKIYIGQALGGSPGMELLHHKIGAHCSPSMWMSSPTWKFSEPYIIENLWSFVM